MKLFLSLLAFLLLVGIVCSFGYVIFLGYEFLSVQWFSLNDDWKTILILFSAVLVFCTLLGTFSIQSSIKKYGLKGTGKVTAYNDFIVWYSDFRCVNNEMPDTDRLKTLVNQMRLWGSKQVNLQTGILYELLVKENFNSDEVMKKAEQVYIEIRRDLGLRGTIKDNPVV